MSVFHFNEGETSMFLKSLFGERGVSLQPTKKEMDILVGALDKGLEVSTYQTRDQIKRWVETTMNRVEVLRLVFLGAEVLKCNVGSDGGEIVLSVREDGQYGTKTFNV